MHEQFTDAHLAAYIEATLDKVDLTLVAGSLGGIRVHPHALEFRGRLEKQRKEHVFVMPLSSYRPGVITAKSLLQIASSVENASWMVGGQPLRNCTAVAFFGSESSVSLHASTQMVGDWLEGRLLGIPLERRAALQAGNVSELQHYLATGLYSDEVCLGTYVDNGGDTLEVRLMPVAPAVEAAPPSMG